MEIKGNQRDSSPRASGLARRTARASGSAGRKVRSLTSREGGRPKSPPHQGQSRGAATLAEFRCSSGGGR